MAIDPGGFKDIAKMIESKYGDGNIHSGSNQPVVARVPTGSPSLDFAMMGGVPIGRFSRFFGASSSGKSLTAWNVIKNAQQIAHVIEAKNLRAIERAKKAGNAELVKSLEKAINDAHKRWPDGMTCIYYNIEKQFEPTLPQSLGLDMDKLQVIEGTEIESLGEKLEALLGVAHVHVLDSLSSAISRDELAAKVGDWHMGIRARAWGKVLGRALERFDKDENVGIMIDQVRDAFGSGGEKPPGGRFIEHTSSMTLHFKRGAWLFRKDSGRLDREGKTDNTLSGQIEPEGMEIVARVVKSRVGRPFRTARMQLDFEGMEFDKLFELTKAATHFGVVEEKGGWYHLPDGAGKKHGRDKFREHLENDEALKFEIEDAMENMNGMMTQQV